MSADRVGSALGVRYEGTPPLGTQDGAPPGLPAVAASAVGAGEVAHRWSASQDARILLERSLEDGSWRLEVAFDPQLGYRVRATGDGDHLVAVDGSSLVSESPVGPEWGGRRLTAAQVLPLVAALRGCEVWHAAAADLDGRMVVLQAPSGTGKSSTLTALLAAGAAFFADDVVAVDRDERGVVVVHPGPRLLNLGSRQLEGLTPAVRARLGTELGRSDKVHIRPPDSIAAARSLDGVVVLDRSASYGSTTIDPIRDVPRAVLAMSYLSYLATRARVVNQLEIAAAVETAVPVVVLRVGVGDGPHMVADAIRRWADGLPRPARAA